MSEPAVPTDPIADTGLGDVLVSLVRTIVPAIVGTVLAWLASRGLDLTSYSNAVNAALVPLFIALYYALVRLAERKWPIAGILLGARRQPKYVPPVTDTAAARADIEHRLTR
jgi:uncharacterized membrane protein (DUF441 family)